MSENYTGIHPRLAQIAQEVELLSGIDRIEAIADAVTSLFPLHNLAYASLRDSLDTDSGQANCMVMSRATAQIAQQFDITPYRLIEVQGLYPHNSSVLKTPDDEWVHVDHQPNAYSFHTSRVKVLGTNKNFDGRLLDSLSTRTYKHVAVGVQQEESVISECPKEAASVLSSCKIPQGILLPEQLAVLAMRKIYSHERPHSESGATTTESTMEFVGKFAACHYAELQLASSN